MYGQNRSDIKIGARVSVVAKLLTKSSAHPYGIKVMLEDGQIGRVQEILDT